MTTEKTSNTWKTMGILGVVFGGLGLILSLFGAIGMYLGILGLILGAIGVFLATKGGKMTLPIIAVVVSLLAAGNGYRMKVAYEEAFDKFGAEFKKGLEEGFKDLENDIENRYKQFISA